MKRFFKKNKNKAKADPEEDAGEDVTVRISNSNVAPLQLRGLFPEKIRGKVFEIGEDGGTIGSLPESTIQIQDSQRSVSRTHCRILWASSDGSYHIADLNSSNSTSLTTDKSTFKLSPQTFFALKSGFIIHIGVEVQLIVAEDKNNPEPQRNPPAPQYAQPGPPQPGPGHDGMNPGGIMPSQYGSQYHHPPPPHMQPNPYSSIQPPPVTPGYGGGGYGYDDHVEVHQSVMTDFSQNPAMHYGSSYVVDYGTNVDAELEETLKALAISTDGGGYSSVAGGAGGSVAGSDPYASIGGGGGGAGGNKVKAYFVKANGQKEVARIAFSNFNSTMDVINGVYLAFQRTSGKITYTDADKDEIEISPTTDFDDIVNFATGITLYE